MAFGHKVGLETVGGHYVGDFFEQLSTFGSRHVAYRSKGMRKMGGLTLDRMLGFHVQFFGHLRAIVTEQVSIERFVVPGYRTSYRRGMRRENGGNGRQYLAQVEQSHAGLPLIEMGNDLIFLTTDVMVIMLDDFCRGTGKHARIVVIAVCMQ